MMKARKALAFFLCPLQLVLIYFKGLSFDRIHDTNFLFQGLTHFFKFLLTPAENFSKFALNILAKVSNENRR
jgi:hypothetical protein